MRLWLVVAGFVLLSGGILARPAPADAGLHFCNKTSLTVWVAYASDDFFGPEHSEGWWKIEPSDCKTAISEALDTSGDTEYYYYAHDSSGGTWSGNDQFCVADDAFSFDSSSCSQKKGFRSLDPHGQSDYWFDLTD